MNSDTAKFLSSSKGEQLLIKAAEYQGNEFALAKFLRTQTTPEYAAAVNTVIKLRQKATIKFSKAEQMLFTRSSLEQASAENISHYRLLRLLNKKITSIIDLGCAIGGDSIAYSSKLLTTGVELNPARLILAEHNIAVYNNTQRFTPFKADITELNPLNIAAEAFFIDPARRTPQGKRLFSPESWSPKLSEIFRWLEKIPNGIVKAAPGIAHINIPAEAEADFISYKGELRECVLWFGNLRNGNKRQATLIDKGVILSGENPYIPIEKIKNYIYEPDSAVIRAGLVELLAGKINATKISANIAFLTTEEKIETPFAKCFKVISSMQYNEKELKKELKKLDCGTLNVIKRGSPIEVPALLKRLKLKGKNYFTLLLTREGEKRTAIIAKPG